MKPIGDSEQLKAFFRTGHKRQYQKNELILLAGEEPPGVFLIESGLIKIYIIDKYGNEHITHFFGAGDFFPVMWLLRGDVRNSNYRALEPVTVWVAPQEKLMNLIMDSKEILAEMLNEMTERYLRYAGRIENLLYTDARERCAYRLLSLGNRFGLATKEGLVINASITQEDMARSVNMTRETFGRCLSRFQQKDQIGYDDDRHIIIKDVAALIKIIGREEAESTWPDLMKFVID